VAAAEVRVGRPARLPLILGLTLLAAQAAAGWRLQEPRGYDFRFHLSSWLEVAEQWREGTVFPRWSLWAYWGFGEPRFIFYPPGSPMLGAALGSVLPWPLVPQAFVCLALVAAGFSMYRFARETLDPEAAAWAGVFYALNPYALIMVNGRSSLAELLASVFLPLLVLYGSRLAEGRKGALVPLALSLAAVWLTNTPTAVLATYGLGLLLAVFAWRARRGPILWSGAGAVILALLLAAFYVIPAAREMRWVTIDAVVTPMLQPQNNFLFTRSPLRHGGFNLVVSLAAAAQIGAAALAVALAGRSPRSRPPVRGAVLALAAGCVVFMTPLSVLAWRWLPNLRFVQFPWRLLAMFSVAGAYLMAAAAPPQGKTAWRLAVLAVWVGAGVFSYRLSIWKPGVLAEVRAGIQDGSGWFRGGREYLPAGCSADGLPRNLPKVSLLAEESGIVHVERWVASERVLTVDTPNPGTLVLRLFDYPAWRVRVEGADAPKTRWGANGLIAVAVPAGRSRVEARFIRTPDRTIGGLVSALGAVLAAAVFFRARRSASGAQ
jgi:hypothetical protein